MSMLQRHSPVPDGRRCADLACGDISLSFSPKSQSVFLSLL